MDIIDILFELPTALVQLAKVLQNFLFDTIKIGNTNVSLWLIICGVGIVAVLVYSFIKN